MRPESFCLLPRSSLAYLISSMSTPTIHYFRLLSEVVGISPGSVITAIWDGTRFLVSRDQWGTSYFSVEDISAVAVEVGEDERATYIESINSLDISSVQGAIDSEVKSLLSGDALSVSDDRTLALPASKFGQFRNGALLLSRRADQFKAIIENNTRVIAQNAAALKVKAELEASSLRCQYNDSGSAVGRSASESSSGRAGARFATGLFQYLEARRSRTR